MERNELYLQTAFVCMACDGEIATKELELIKSFCTNTDTFSGLDVENILNKYVAKINEEGIVFIQRFIKELAQIELLEKEQLKVIEVAIKMIEADEKIEYSEIAFFKKIRSALTISDEKILEFMPNKEDYLLPDIQTKDSEIDFNSNFDFINLADIKSNGLMGQNI